MRKPFISFRVGFSKMLWKFDIFDWGPKKVRCFFFARVPGYSVLYFSDKQFSLPVYSQTYMFVS